MKQERLAYILGILTGILFIVPFSMMVLDACPYNLVYPYFKETDYLLAGWGGDTFAWVIDDLYVQEDGSIFAPTSVRSNTTPLLIKYGCIAVIIIIGLDHYSKTSHIPSNSGQEATQ